MIFFFNFFQTWFWTLRIFMVFYLFEIFVSPKIVQFRSASLLLIQLKIKKAFRKPLFFVLNIFRDIKTVWSLLRRRSLQIVTREISTSVDDLLFFNKIGQKQRYISLCVRPRFSGTTNQPVHVLTLIWLDKYRSFLAHCSCRVSRSTY